MANPNKYAPGHLGHFASELDLRRLSSVNEFDLAHVELTNVRSQGAGSTGRRNDAS